MIKRYIVPMAMFILVAGVSAQENEYKGKIVVSPVAIEQKRDSVYIDLNLDLSGVVVDTRKSISLVPALVVSGNRMDLPEIVIKGKTNYNLYRRERALMSRHQRDESDKNAPYAVLKGFSSGQPGKLGYRTAVKYEPWMDGARLEMYEDVCGCGNPARRLGTEVLSDRIIPEVIIPEIYSVTPYIVYLKPEVESIKRREIIGEAYLDFAVNQTQIRPDYRDNPAELKKITDLIQDVKSDPDVQIRKISVIGYASPEGTLAGNQRLSEGRANALVDYLLPGFDYPRNIFNVIFGGENWEGLKERVESSDMLYRKEVLDILTSIPAEINYKTGTSRKKALMELKGGEPYRYMLREFYPSLRKAICKIDFDVRNFDVEQARDIVKSRPQNLSLNEMFLVANTYDKGSDDFIDLFETAVRLFPDDIVANLNAASAALARTDWVTAEKFLNKIDGKTSVPEYKNAKGILLMLKGEFDQAEVLLREAMKAGLPEAGKNMEELSRKRENAALIEERIQKRNR